jgi:hypothetical protein
MEQYIPGWRFQFPPDGIEMIDCNPDFTISDIWGLASWLWTWPGDWLLSQELLKTFFEIDGPSAIGAGASYVLPWLAFLIIVAVR